MAEWSKASLIHRIKLSQVRILAELLSFFKFCPNFKGLYLVSAKFRDTGIFFVKSTVSELPLHIGLIWVFLHILSQNWLWKLCFYYAKMSKNWSGVRIPDFPSYFWPFLNFFDMLKKIEGAIHVQNLPLKPKKHKIEKYFVAPSAPLC